MSLPVHLVDEHLPADNGYALTCAAACESGRILSFGPAPQQPGLPAVERVNPRRSLGGVPERLQWRGPAFADRASTVHCWSPTCLTAAASLARWWDVGLVVHLPSAAWARGLALGRLIARHERSVTVIVPAEPSVRRLMAEGVPAEAIHIQPPQPPVTTDLPQRRRRVREQLGIAEGMQVVVAPDEMIRIAGHKYAVWSHAILRQIKDNLRLLLPTPGPSRGALEHFADTTWYLQELLLPNDPLPLADALAAADVVAFLREDDCGLTAPAAALAAGLPIVASQTPDMSALLEGKASLVPAKDPRRASIALLRTLEQVARQT